MRVQSWRNSFVISLGLQTRACLLGSHPPSFTWHIRIQHSLCGSSSSSGIWGVTKKERSKRMGSYVSG